MTYEEQKEEAIRRLGAIIQSSEEDGPMEYVDNHRVALLSSTEDNAAYNKQKDQGCCGSMDRIIIVDGVNWRVGCNYGH